MRTATGLAQFDPQFRTTAGLIDCGTQGGSGGSLSAAANPDSVYGSVSRKFSTSVSTNLATVTPAGGSGPYSYAWAPQAGWTISNPSSATTSFASPVGPGDDITQTFACTVTDSAGATIVVYVNAEVSNYYSGGGNVAI